MRFDLENSRTVVIGLLLISAINIMPLPVMFSLKYFLAADGYFHRTLINCFSRQFWQGDIYPRWCMDINAGLGAPIFIFYFPLPYFVTALLYPLKYLGASPYAIYIIGIFLATMAGASSCYSWLKDVVSPGRALIATSFFLFAPYRIEAMFFRADYAELWAISWLPLLFKYVRRAAKGEREATTPMAMVFALLLLSNVPCAVAGMIASGLYMVVVSRKSWRPWFHYATSLIWGVAMVAFYVIPAAYYSRFVPTPDGWPDGYLFINLRHGFIVVFTPLNILVLSIVSILLLCKYSGIGDKFMQSEIRAWIIIFIALLFLTLPISKPLYHFLPSLLTYIVFPYRMQNLFTLCLAFMIAVWIQYFINDRQMKTWKADYLVLLAALILVSYLMFSIRSGEQEKFVDAGYAPYDVYRTIWVNPDYYKEDYILSRYDNKNNIPRIEIISGKGGAVSKQWDWRGIMLQTNSKQEMTVRLDHYWFPTWRATMDSGQTAIFRPEPETGKMLLDIPAGSHFIYLKHSVFFAHPWLQLANLASILAIFLWLLKTVPNYKWRNMFS